MNNTAIIAYDISDDKLRLRLFNFLGKSGVRIQLSVFEITNSEKVLRKVLKGIDEEFRPLLASTDSIYVFKVNQRETLHYGAAAESAKQVKSSLIIL